LGFPFTGILEPWNPAITNPFGDDPENKSSEIKVLLQVVLNLDISHIVNNSGARSRNSGVRIKWKPFSRIFETARFS